MHEKYSINLTPPTLKKQHPTGLSREEESVWMAKAEKGLLTQEPSMTAWLPRGLRLWPQVGGTGLRRSPTSRRRPAKSHPCRALRVLSGMLCSAQSMQTQWPVNLYKIKIHTWLSSQQSVGVAPTWQGWKAMDTLDGHTRRMAGEWKTVLKHEPEYVRTFFF